MKPNRTFWIAVGSTAVIVLVAVLINGRVSSSNVEAAKTVAPAAKHRKASPEAASEAPKPGLEAVARPDLPKTQLLRSIVTAIEGVHGEAGVLKRDARLQKIAAGVATTDLPAIVDFLANKPFLSPAGQVLRAELVDRWAKENPRAAADWVKVQPEGNARTESIKQISAVWANINAADAVSWAQQLANPTEQETSLANVAYELTRILPMEAMKLAVEMPEGNTRSDLLSHVASEWAGTEPKAAADWVNQIQDATLRESLLASVLTAWGSQNPTEAASFALSSLSPGRSQDDAVVGIVQNWAQTDPETAAGWITQFPEGSLRQTAIESLVSVWAGADLEKAANWLNGLAAGPVRDVAVGALVSKVLPLSPKSAADWALEIGDNDRRQQELKNVGTAWLEKDRVAARDWISNSPLSADAKALLLASGTTTAQVQATE